MLFTLLRIVALLAVALLSAVGAVFLFRPDVGAALARSAAQAMARAQAAADLRGTGSQPEHGRHHQTGAVPQRRRTPRERADRGAEPFGSPHHRADGSAADYCTAYRAGRPAAPPTPVPPTQAPAVAGGDPVQAVVGFYTLVAEHQFDQAAHLWSARMQADYPPDENIDHRFAATRSINVNSAQVVATDQGAGAATVAVDLTEVSGDPPATHHWTGRWRLVRTPWLAARPAQLLERVQSAK